MGFQNLPATWLPAEPKARRKSLCKVAEIDVGKRWNPASRRPSCRPRTRSTRPTASRISSRVVQMHADKQNLNAQDHFPVPYTIIVSAGGAAPTVKNWKAGHPAAPRRRSKQGAPVRAATTSRSRSTPTSTSMRRQVRLEAPPQRQAHRVGAVRPERGRQHRLPVRRVQPGVAAGRPEPDHGLPDAACPARRDSRATSPAWTAASPPSPCRWCSPRTSSAAPPTRSSGTS